MSQEFQRDYLIRLPLPLAQLYQRAHNDKSAQSRHNNTFYLFEALVKLATAPAVAAYLQEVDQGGPRVAELDRLLVHLALPSLGQWVAMLRGLARHFGTRPDAAAHPLGHVWEQLNRPYRDRPGLLALYRRIKNGLDGAPAGHQSCTPLQVIDALVPYRNAVFGHGGGRFESFYETEMGPLLFPAANEILAEGMLDVLGPRGTRLVHLAELRMLDEDRVEVGLRELVGEHSARTAPLVLSRAEADGLVPDRVAVLWPGRQVPLRLDPLVLYREREMGDEVLFLNRDRNGRQVEYLSYTRGEPERDRATAGALAALLGRVTGRAVGTDQLDALAQQSAGETPSVEALLGTPTTPARTLGDYEILAEIGRGGMGVVYLARQLSLGRLVALKMLPPDLAGDEVALARFRREMRLLAHCDHPHIVKVLVSGTFPDGRLYYAMEYVPGCDLEQVWRELSGSDQPGDASSLGGSTWARAVLSASRKKREKMTPRAAATTEDAPVEGPLPALPLPPLPGLPSAEDDPRGYARRVALLVRDAARALQAIHYQQVVHRDVKPANLMLTPDGARVVLMDFGLAKGQSLSLSASKAGGLLGTLRYAAPEQLAAASLKVGPAADVRGLGVTLWELLTRRRLFAEAEDERQLAILVHDHDVPLLRTIDPGLDRDMEAIVARATERRATDRIATAGLLADYLQLYLDGKPLPIRPPTMGEMAGRWLRAHKGLVGSAAAAALAIVATVVVAFVVIAGSRDQEIQSRNQAVKLTVEKEGIAEKERGQRIESQRRLANLYLERGVSLCTQGRAGDGLLWLAQALKDSPDDPSAVDQQRVIRMQLGGWIGQVHPLLQLMQHQASVNAVAFSPDGKAVLTGCHDKTARLWDVSTGQPIAPPLQHRGYVSDVAFSPDGKTVLTGSWDKTARLWDASTGQPIGTPLQHQDSVNAVAFSPDGKTVLTGSHDKTARIWDASTGQPIGTPLQHQDSVNAVAFSSDGKVVLTGCEDNTARIWDASTGQPIGTPLQHQDSVDAVAFSPDSKAVLTGSEDKTARIWDASTGQPSGTLLQHQGYVFSVAFSPDGKAVLTGCEDNTARTWDAFTGQPSAAPFQHQGPVNSVAFSPDSKAVLTASADKTARIWDASTGQPSAASLQHQNLVLAVAFSSDGKAVLTASADKTARIWDSSTGQPIGSPLQHQGSVDAVAFSPDSKAVLTGSDDNTARIWDAATGQPIGSPLQHQGAVMAVAFSPDSKAVLTGSRDNTARIWDAPTGQPIGSPLQHQGSVDAVAFSPDSKAVLTGSWDKTARIWDAATGQPIGSPLQHQEAVCAVAFSPDGKAVLTGSFDETARIWDAATGQPIGSPLQHQGAVMAVAFTPDGTAVLTGSQDRRARIWDSSTGQPVGTPLQHRGWVNAVAFSPDGTAVLTGSQDKTARIWDAATRQPIGSPLQHQEAVWAVAFSPDGKAVLTGSWDKTARLWRVPKWEGRPDRIVHDIEIITGAFLDPSGSVQVMHPATGYRRRHQVE